LAAKRGSDTLLGLSDDPGSDRGACPPTPACRFQRSQEACLHPAEVRETNRRAAAMLIGISLGAVFVGSMTYIGNGPNFMVRAIAEQAGVKMPSLFGYVILYSAPVLLPVFFIATLIFLL
jgi:hypothetical protein